LAGPYPEEYLSVKAGAPGYFWVTTRFEVLAFQGNPLFLVVIIPIGIGTRAP